MAWGVATQRFFRTATRGTANSRLLCSGRCSGLGSHGIGRFGSKSFVMKRACRQTLGSGRASSRTWRSLIIFFYWRRPMLPALSGWRKKFIGGGRTALTRMY